MTAPPSVLDEARALLGRTLVAHGVTVRLTEVEAYGGTDDPASHAWTRTARSEIMYGEPGRLYVYRSYGLHFCANVVTGPTETASAVLLRAGEVVDGLDLARARRGLAAGADDARLGRGPGNLASALGLTLADNGRDLLAGPADGLDGLDGGAVHLGPEVEPAVDVGSGPRVGVARAADVPWRLWLPGEPSVSSYRRSPRAPRP